jgi:hypothetical protein
MGVDFYATPGPLTELSPDQRDVVRRLGLTITR